jgi:hypothetical protein
MIERVLEPEAIDTMADPLEYDSMDFSEGNAAFAEKALELLPDSLLHHIPDPTQVLIEIN